MEYHKLASTKSSDPMNLPPGAKLPKSKDGRSLEQRRKGQLAMRQMLERSKQPWVPDAKALREAEVSPTTTRPTARHEPTTHGQQRSPHTTHHSPLTSHLSPLTSHLSPVDTRHSTLDTRHPPLTITHHSPPTTLHPPLVIPLL